MMDYLILIITAFYFMLPAYCANGAPVITKGILKKLAYPIDFNKKFRDRPIFGTHKTYRGFLMAVLTGIVVFAIQKHLYSYELFAKISLLDYTSYTILLGFLMGFGAITGDLIKSFFKRQLNHKAGSRWIPFDQLDFVAGALLFSAFVYLPSLKVILILFVLGFFVHVTSNHIAFWIGIRDVKW